MDIVDLRDNKRIAAVMVMLRKLSKAQTPAEVMTNFATDYWPLRPTDYMVSLSCAGLPPGQYRVTRQIDVREVLAGRLVPDKSTILRPRESFPSRSGGFLGEVIAEARPLIVRDMRLKGDPVLGDTLSEMRSAMALPLYSEGEVLYWNIQFRTKPDAFDADQLEHAVIVSNMVGGTNTRLGYLNEIKKLNQALTAQLEEVAAVQRALLPARLPDIPGLEIAASYLTSDQAGGDYYDFFRFEDGTWGILIADVSGHGPAAATIMAMLHGILHAYEGTRKGPEVVLRFANRRLVEAGLEGNFVTAFFAVFDPRDAGLAFARSGHNPPRLKAGSGGEVRELDGAGAGLPLGITEPYEVRSDRVTLRDHDTVILYTDGITEAFNSSREMFGVGRLDRALEQCTGQPDCVVDSVHAALFEHTGVRTRVDDQTLVALRYHAPG